MVNLPLRIITRTSRSVCNRVAELSEFWRAPFRLICQIPTMRVEQRFAHESHSLHPKFFNLTLLGPIKLRAWIQSCHVWLREKAWSWGFSIGEFRALPTILLLTSLRQSLNFDTEFVIHEVVLPWCFVCRWCDMLLMLYRKRLLRQNCLTHLNSIYSTVLDIVLTQFITPIPSSRNSSHFYARLTIPFFAVPFFISTCCCRSGIASAPPTASYFPTEAAT